MGRQIVDQAYERGWRRYSFEEPAAREVRAHGADIVIRAASAVNRGPGELQMSLLELPPHGEGDAIGLHIHRDVPTGEDVEEVYIILEGLGTMTFTTGEKVGLAPGHVVTTYPGTGHSVRVTGAAPMRIVVVVPHAFRIDGSAGPVDVFPDMFAPRIRVTKCDPRSMSPQEALCSSCGGAWRTAPGDELPHWAASHECATSA
jgi:mannose-6-phosphate isomerase-like protein (cupin superfamily)